MDLIEKLTLPIKNAKARGFLHRRNINPFTETGELTTSKEVSAGPVILYENYLSFRAGVYNRSDMTRAYTNTQGMLVATLTDIPEKLKIVLNIGETIKSSADIGFAKRCINVIGLNHELIEALEYSLIKKILKRKKMPLPKGFVPKERFAHCSPIVLVREFQAINAVLRNYPGTDALNAHLILREAGGELEYIRDVLKSIHRDIDIPTVDKRYSRHTLKHLTRICLERGTLIFGVNEYNEAIVLV